MLLTLALMLCGVSAFAEAPAGEVILSPDGILSIQAPSASWHALSVADAWFAVGNETDTITINHLNNGEALPASMVANDRYGAVYQANFSTPNEVFCVMGRAVREEDLETLIQAIGSIKILKKNTKAAASVNDPFAGTGCSLRPINRVYTCTSDPLILRTSWTYQSAKAGRLQYGQAVMVNGAVTRNGEDIGWYQLQFNNGIAYGPSQCFSPASAITGLSSRKKTSSNSMPGIWAMTRPMMCRMKKTSSSSTRVIWAMTSRTMCRMKKTSSNSMRRIWAMMNPAMINP